MHRSCVQTYSTLFKPPRCTRAPRQFVLLSHFLGPGGGVGAGTLGRREGGAGREPSRKFVGPFGGGGVGLLGLTFFLHEWRLSYGNNADVC